jgi:hypothetical protein
MDGGRDARGDLLQQMVRRRLVVESAAEVEILLFVEGGRRGIADGLPYVPVSRRAAPPGGPGWARMGACAPG